MLRLIFVFVCVCFVDLVVWRGWDVAFAEQPILQENYPFLRQKICLMALIESVFKRDAYDRTMSFQTIAEETRLPLDEVEHLVMKALRCVLFSSSSSSSFFWGRCFLVFVLVCEETFGRKWMRLARL